MTTPGVTSSKIPLQFIDPDQPTISQECECVDDEQRGSYCSCTQVGGTDNPPPSGEEEIDRGTYFWAFVGMSLGFLAVGGIYWCLQRLWPDKFWHEKTPPSMPDWMTKRIPKLAEWLKKRGIPLSPGPMMIFMGLSSLFRRRDSASVASSPQSAPRPAAQTLLKLMDDFNLYVGRYIPNYDLLQDRLSTDFRLPLFDLSQNARQYYVQRLIDSYVQEVIDHYKPANATNALPSLDIGGYIAQYPLASPDGRIAANERAGGYVRVSKEVMANAVTRVTKERVVRAQFRRRMGNGSYFSDYLGSTAFLMWRDIMAPRRREWFVSNTSQDLIARPGELPPLLETWFLNNAKPRLEDQLKNAWALMPEIFRNAMGRPAGQSDSYPDVFYEMMLALDLNAELEKNLARILERDAAPVDMDGLPQTGALTAERRSIVAANPELASYSHFVVVLANARLAVAQNRSATNGNGTSGTSGAGGAGTAGSGEPGAVPSRGTVTTSTVRAGASDPWWAHAFMPFAPAPLGIWSGLRKLFSVVPPASDSEAPPAPDTPATPQGLPANSQLDPQKVALQYRTTYGERLRALGIGSDKDMDVVISYFAAMGMAPYVGKQTPGGELSQKIVEQSEQWLIHTVSRSTRTHRRTLWPQIIPPLLKLAHVFRWVEGNEPEVARKGFKAIDERAEEIVKGWNKIPHKTQKKDYGYTGGPIPQRYLARLHAPAPRIRPAPQAPSGILSIPPASDVPFLSASREPEVSVAAPSRVEESTESQTPEPARYIMNLEAFDISPASYVYLTNMVKREFAYIGLPDEYIETIAQAVMFRWQLHLVTTHPNTSLNHMSSKERIPPDVFVIKEAWALRNKFPGLVEIPQDREGLHRFIYDRMITFDPYDVQTARYLSQLAMSAFERSFFSRQNSRFNIDRLFVTLFRIEFALRKVKELQDVWNRMPEELQRALGTIESGNKYPSLFIELMLSAKHGLDIDHMLQRDERPIRIDYPRSVVDPRSPIAKAVDDELAHRNPVLLHYGNIFRRLSDHIATERQETMAHSIKSAPVRAAQQEATSTATESARSEPERSRPVLTRSRPVSPAQPAQSHYRVLSTRPFAQLYGILSYNIQYVLVISDTLSRTLELDYSDVPTIARIIEFRWLLLKGRSIDPPDAQFIREQAASLSKDPFLRQFRDTADEIETLDEEHLSSRIRAIFSSSSVGGTETNGNYLGQLAVLAFRKPFFSEHDGVFRVPRLFMHLFINEYAHPKLRELDEVWGKMPRPLQDALGGKQSGHYPPLFTDFMLAVADRNDELGFYFKEGSRFDINYDSGILVDGRRQAKGELLAEHPGLAHYPHVLDVLMWHYAEKREDAKKRGGEGSGGTPRGGAAPAAQGGQVAGGGQPVDGSERASSPEQESTSTVSGVFDPEELSTGAGLAPMDSSPVTTGASILFGRQRQVAHRPATYTARPASVFRPAVLARPAVSTVPAL